KSAARGGALRGAPPPPCSVIAAFAHPATKPDVHARRNASAACSGDPARRVNISRPSSLQAQPDPLEHKVDSIDARVRHPFRRLCSHDASQNRTLWPGWWSPTPWARLIAPKTTTHAEV